MNDLLDTNILITYLRNNLSRSFIESNYDPFSINNTPIISVGTVGEIKSIAKRNNWGKRRLSLLSEILDDLVRADINAENVIEKYAEN